MNKDEKRALGSAALHRKELRRKRLMDNNASELLFKHCGKPKAIEKYMRNLGFRDIHVRMTEEQIHKNPAKAIENSSTPADYLKVCKT